MSKVDRQQPDFQAFQALVDDAEALRSLIEGLRRAAASTTLIPVKTTATGLPDLTGYSARQISTAVLTQHGGTRVPALVRTYLNQDLEARSGKRAIGGAQDRVTRT